MPSLRWTYSYTPLTSPHFTPLVQSFMRYLPSDLFYSAWALQNKTFTPCPKIFSATLNTILSLKFSQTPLNPLKSPFKRSKRHISAAVHRIRDLMPPIDSVRRLQYGEEKGPAKSQPRLPSGVHTCTTLTPRGDQHVHPTRILPHQYNPPRRGYIRINTTQNCWCPKNPTTLVQNRSPMLP